MAGKNSFKKKEKKDHPVEKNRLHPRNKHRFRYDFSLLVKTCPSLSSFIIINQYEDATIDFADSKAVKMLNTALLMKDYDITEWDIPEGYLCPPVPGRADYIHYIADLCAQKNFGKIPVGSSVRCLDIGTGAGMIYPIIGAKEYNWSFVGTEIDLESLVSAQSILNIHPHLSSLVQLRHQKMPEKVFENIFSYDEWFDLTVCNPPFYGSAEEASEASMRKNVNLHGPSSNIENRNFGGRGHETWCPGGERRFIESMIEESRAYASRCFWFTTLVSRSSDLRQAQRALHKAGVIENKIIPMGQGNKTSRIMAWTFLKPEQQKNWIKLRWESALS